MHDAISIPNKLGDRVGSLAKHEIKKGKEHLQWLNGMFGDCCIGNSEWSKWIVGGEAQATNINPMLDWKAITLKNIWLLSLSVRLQNCGWFIIGHLSAHHSWFLSSLSINIYEKNQPMTHKTSLASFSFIYKKKSKNGGALFYIIKVSTNFFIKKTCRSNKPLFLWTDGEYISKKLTLLNFFVKHIKKIEIKPKLINFFTINL